MYFAVFQLIFIMFIMNIKVNKWINLKVIMKANGLKKPLQVVKEWMFQYIFVIDSNRFTNLKLMLLMTILELTALHYYYLHPNYQIFSHFDFIQQYFDSIRPYFAHITSFHDSTFAIITLMIYPIAALLALVIKKIGPNRIILLMVQILVYIYPLIMIKIMVEMISSIKMGQYIYLTLPLGLFSLIFGALLLVIQSKIYRYIQLPIILMLQLDAHDYVMLAFLSLRLIALFYMHYPHKMQILPTLFQLSLFLILFSCIFCDQQFLNYISFLIIIVAFLIYGSSLINRYLRQNRDIYQFADQLEEEQSIFQIYHLVQLHHIECAYSTCKCHSFWELKQDDLKDWVYEFEEQRLKRRQSLNDRIFYAEKCCEKYQYRLNGLIRICEYIPKSLIQQYQVFKVCLAYEINLRRQDKNYKYGQVYLNVHEQMQLFSKGIQDVLLMIKQFWGLITNFDGSTKFLSSILSISNSIAVLKQNYHKYIQKYDDQSRQFKYLFDLFQTIILNQNIVEEDQLVIPDSVIFLITNQQRIINANNHFATLVSSTLDSVLQKNYNSFIPQIYRDVHKQWTQNFVQKLTQYDGKHITKCLALGSIQVKLVDMEHRILPRFLNGLQIFTIIRCPPPQRKNVPDSFFFIVEKQSFFIKNVQATFFDVIKFKVNQRNFKILQEMALTSIFDSFSPIMSQNPTRETLIYSHFMEQFTYNKKKIQKIQKNSNNITNTQRISIRQKPANLKNSKNKLIPKQSEMIFQYEVLPNSRAEDPYLKVMFHLKEIHKIQGPNQNQSEASAMQQDHSSQQKTNLNKNEKQVNYHIPYYMLGLLAAIHVIYILSSNVFSNTITIITNKYEFYLSFQYTTLFALGVEVGKDEVFNLRNKWIEGYGDFSQTFNTFQRIQDPYFASYFNNYITIDFHNALFNQIYTDIKNHESILAIYKAIVLIIMLAALLHYLADLLLSLRYIFKIEGKVGDLLLQFVIVDQSDVKQILHVIDNFSVNILNYQHGTQQYQMKVPIQTVQESALELMKGGAFSLNNSLNHGEQQNEVILQKKPLQCIRRGSSNYDVKERVSLSLMKQQFKHQNHHSGFKQDQNKQLDEAQKQRSISLFRQKYGSCAFVIGANKRLFVLVFLSVILACGVIVAILVLLYQPMGQFVKHLWVLQDLYQSKIVLLKSLQQIAVNNFELQPKISISKLFLINTNQINELIGYTSIQNFKEQFNQFLTANKCNNLINYDCSALLNLSLLPNFGINVINQYIQQYYRQNNKAKLTNSNTAHIFIKYQQLLLDILIQDFQKSSNTYLQTVNTIQINLVLIGSALLVLSMIMNHLGLKEFQNRIQDSHNLLKIIPKQIKDKHMTELQELMLAESTL